MQISLRDPTLGQLRQPALQPFFQLASAMTRGKCAGSIHIKATRPHQQKSSFHVTIVRNDWMLRLSQRSSLLLRRRQQWVCTECLGRRWFASQKTDKREPPDHRKLAQQQELFISSTYSPGSPIFLPNGTRIFNRLVDFLRKQYVRYGFEEVITPTIYKKALWARSGHLENYADDMYTVTGAKANKVESMGPGHSCGANRESNAGKDETDDAYGLKPMNCPGHCLIFASKLRSYRDLPIRYADFSPLHRDEISGALSGLTRVRRFHQDDGHIFCRPCQVEEEIKATLDFVKVVYGTLKLGIDFRLALSTRPDHHYMGTVEDWERAESALTRALDASGMAWSVNSGDGAFYGPKIDIVLRDSDGKEHQTATVQLDFQLPKRFELEYQAPAPKLEAQGKSTDDPELLAEFGPVRPVMIHRAVLGSVERLMALLIENYNGAWPFWLNPRQCIILTVTTDEPVTRWAHQVQDTLTGASVVDSADGVCHPTGLAVDVDVTARPLGQKIREATLKGYGRILVAGEKDVERGTVTLGKDAMTPREALDLLRSLVDSYQ